MKRVELQHDNENEMLSPIQASYRLGVTPNLVRKWIKAGKIQAYRFGFKTLRIRVKDLEDFIESNKVQEKVGKE